MNVLKKHPAIFLGLGIIFLFIALFTLGFLDTLELKFYDFRMKLRTDPDSQSSIVMVIIDDDSIDKLGRWPWPRSLLAEGIKKITEGDPKVIGLNLILSEPEESGGLKELKNLEALFSDKALLDTTEGQHFLQLLQAIRDAQERLDNDKKLEQAIAESGRVVLPVSLKYSNYANDESSLEKELLNPYSVQNVRRSEMGGCYQMNEIALPIPTFLNASSGIGHFNIGYDKDGITRREQLLYEFNGLFIPSYTLKIASVFKNIPNDNIKAELGMSLTLGTSTIPLTETSALLVSFKGAEGSFKQYSYFDLINDKFPLNVFKNKIVLIAPSATGFNPISTPTETYMPMGEFSANVIWSILNDQFIQELPSSSLLTFCMIIFTGLLIAFLFPRLKALYAGITFFVLLILLIGTSTFLFVGKGLWIPIVYPVFELILGYIGVVSIRYFVTETGKEKVEGESAETNRMLGISFQEQGMLDMAFDKFRKVPVDDQMKDILYNLGLDYERKRQFNKAAAVYEYIENHDKKFKDVTDRKKKLMQASETMVFGDGFLGGSKGDSLMSTGTDTRPRLGRYEIIKQLGKGAMGIVYLGQDPRINRTTAIKTVRFSDDFEPEEAKKMKEKFFREAESAGTLSHPNIVTIYDAGDEQDLAYIAMEFLEGDDLDKFTKPDKLLPIRKVIDYMADVADALDYAHQKGIVHRDIKPANIMLLKSGVVKITDFGIARITATSQTQTGVVKGTPYYMSPEQISGKKVDGRTDLFSVGVMMFQLLTGKVPFTGDSPAALMHQILNEPPPDPRKYNQKIYKPLVTIINKALEKNPDNRYLHGSKMAGHLRELGKKIDAALEKKKT